MELYLHLDLCMMYYILYIIIIYYYILFIYYTYQLCLNSEHSIGLVFSPLGDLLLVGAPLEDLNGTDAGGAYVYVLSGGLWTLEARLVAHDVAPGDRFGSAVRLWQGYAVVGAAGHDTGGLADTGAAYIFWKSPLEGWLQQAFGQLEVA